MAPLRLRFGSEGRATDAGSRRPRAPISNATLVIISPNGGEELENGEEIEISWSTTGSFESFDVAVSTDGGSSWTDITTGLAGSSTTYGWTPDTDSETTLIRVTGHNPFVSFSDASDTVFAVVTSEVVWPSATPIEDFPNAVSAWYADQATDTGSPSYVMSTLVDVVNGGNHTGGTLERRNPPSNYAFGHASSTTQMTKLYPGTDAEWKSCLGNVSGRLVTYGLTFVVRATTFGYFGWTSTSFSARMFVRVTSTHCYFEWGNSGGTTTINLAHGLTDTDEMSNWIVLVYESGGVVHADWYRNGDNLIASGTGTTRSFSFANPTHKLGGNTGVDTSFLAGASYRGKLSAGNRATIGA